jgi:hypothetical protein
MHVRHIEDQVLDSRFAKISAHLDYVLWAHGLRTEVDAAKGSALNLLVVSPHVLAVAPQNLQLVPDRPRSPLRDPTIPQKVTNVSIYDKGPGYNVVLSRILQTDFGEFYFYALR